MRQGGQDVDSTRHVPPKRHDGVVKNAPYRHSRRILNATARRNNHNSSFAHIHTLLLSVRGEDTLTLSVDVTPSVSTRCYYHFDLTTRIAMSTFVLPGAFASLVAKSPLDLSLVAERGISLHTHHFHLTRKMQYRKVRSAHSPFSPFLKHSQSSQPPKLIPSPYTPRPSETYKPAWYYSLPKPHNHRYTSSL